MAEAQKLVAQAADLLPTIHSSIQHGIQSQNDTTKGGWYQTCVAPSCAAHAQRTHTPKNLVLKLIWVSEHEHIFVFWAVWSAVVTCNCKRMQ